MSNLNKPNGNGSEVTELLSANDSEDGISPEVEPGSIRSIDENPLVSIVDSHEMNVNVAPDSYWRSVSNDIGGTSMSPYKTEVVYNNKIRERTLDRFSDKHPQEEEAVFYKLVNNQPESESNSEEVQRIITSITLTKDSGEKYTAWYEFTYLFRSDGSLRKRSYVFLYESGDSNQSDVLKGEEILQNAKSNTVPKINKIREKVKTGTRYGNTYPVNQDIKNYDRQEEYFNGEGARHLEVVSRSVEIEYEAYKWEYPKVMRENRSRKKDDEKTKKVKKEMRESIKTKSINRLVDSNGTLFMVEMIFKENDSTSQTGIKVKVDEINVMYLGNIESVDSIDLPNDFADKDNFVHWREKVDDELSDSNIDVVFSGFDDISETQTNQEKFYLIKKAKNMVRQRLFENEIDLAIPINYGPEGEEPNFEIVYFTFLSSKNSNGSITISIKRIGKANDADSNHGNAEKLRLKDIEGYKDSFSKDELVTFLGKRYKILKSVIENLETKEDVLISAEQFMTQNAGTKEWFKTNYNIDIWNASEKEDEAIALLKKRYKYDSRNSGRQMHPDVINSGGSETDGLKDWTSKELRFLEMSLQKFSDSLIVLLDGINYIRQDHCLLKKHYKLPSGIEHHHPSYKDTIVIYNKAFISSSDSKPKEEYSFRGNTEDVSSALTGTLTHETGHVIQHLGPKGNDNGDRFVYFYSNIVNGPDHGYESEGITGYSRGELNPGDDPVKIKEHEYFPEAFDLFMHDPEGLYRARPKVYMWFAYLQKNGIGPSTSVSKKFVQKWMDHKKAHGTAPDLQTSLTFIQ